MKKLIAALLLLVGCAADSIQHNFKLQQLESVEAEARDPER